MSGTRLTIVIPASQKDVANQWMKLEVDKEGGGGTFTSPYTDGGGGTFTSPYTDGVDTYYVASGQWSEQQAADLIAHFGEDACEGDPQEVLNGLSLTPFFA